MRLKLALIVVGLFATIAVTGASAADFEKDFGSGADCTYPPEGGQLVRCPTAYVGEEYEIEMESEPGSGCTTLDGSNPYTWYEIVNGGLPPGLSMTRAGVISGTPTSTGLWRFWVWNHDVTYAQGGPDWCLNEDRSEIEMSISVEAGLVITSDSVEPATVGQPYSETLTAQQVANLNPRTGSEVQATWSLASGALPPGLALSLAGVLSGTPSAEGSWQFQVKAQNGAQSDTETFAISARRPLTVAPSKPLATPPRPSVWEVAVPFSAKLTPSGGSGTYTFALGTGTLPTGLVLGPDGTILGTPRTAGVYRATVKVSDSDGRTVDYAANFGVAARLAVSTLALKQGEVGRLYRTRLASTGGLPVRRWKVLTGPLPKGVHLNPTLGTLLGTPTKAGSYRVTFQVTDGLKVAAKKTLRIVVAP